MERNSEGGATMANQAHHEARHILLVNRRFEDLNPIVAGYEKCKPSHRYGPAVRHYTLLHCILSGKGTYTCGGKSYPVHAGQIFRILPEDETVYQADGEDPWYYFWIGFDGKLSERMRELPPVFDATPTATRIFRQAVTRTGMSEYGFSASLFELYEELFPEKRKNGSDYVRKIKNYIDAMYMEKISIEGLADRLHINRRYLTRLFHGETGMSIRDYLLETRMREATECLRNGLTVGETAERCGYEDMFMFSRLFKKRFGVSPQKWKNIE